MYIYKQIIAHLTDKEKQNKGYYLHLIGVINKLIHKHTL